MTNVSVTRTASDALLAKWSALDAGYRPVGIRGDVYGDLLQQMTAAALEKESIRQKRQSPLVNAGYAARIAAMTYVVQSFLSFHNNTTALLDDPTETPLQVVLLGCGFDILGLWASCHQRKSIKLFELDTFEIVMAKKELLISMGWLQVISTEREDEGTIVEGIIHPKMGVQDAAEESSALYPHSYTLAACDLKNVSSVETALSNLDNTIPTLVLSELVLVYLGRQGIDDLLMCCASTVCVTRGSALVAYEALGPFTYDKKSGHSVIEGYKRQYCEHFRDKLQRGIVSDDKSSNQDDFHPLGDSPGSVKKRFTAAGFPSAYAGLAGTVAAYIFDHDRDTKENRRFQPCEPFDEHAALALHLHSYILLCAFPADTDIGLIRSMCPWSTTSWYDMKAKVVRVYGSSEIIITPIEASDQCQVQELFTSTYAVLSKQYSAVRKMVKTALQTDLNFSLLNGTFSSIGLRYQSCGGVFLVAVKISAPRANDDKSRSLTRNVIGCLGIRLCDANEGTVREGHRNTFEIHRLAVDANSRGRGVGKALLASVQEDFLRFELGDDESFRLVATTPDLLTTANHLYASSGFEMQKQEIVGKMTINTYVKESARTKILGTSDGLIDNDVH